MSDDKTAFARQRYNSTAKFYNFIEMPMELILFKRWRQDFFRLLEGQRILEIGVGTGKNIDFYPPHSHLVGIDLSEGMLNKARSKMSRNVRLLQMDAERLAFPDHTFDMVIGTFVFCSIPRPAWALREIQRVLKPNGRLLLMEHVLPEKRTLRWFLKKMNGFVYKKTGVEIARQTGNTIQQSGLQIVSSENLLATVVRRFQAVNYSD